MRNPLFHRLSRHGSLAIVNHPAAGTRSITGASSAPAAPAATAYLWPVEPGEAVEPPQPTRSTSPLAEPARQPVMPSAAHHTVQASAAPRPTSQPSAQAPTANAILKPVQPPSASGVLGAPGRPQPPEPSSPAKGIDDSTWSTLENIFHRHQQTEGTSPAPQQPSGPDVVQESPKETESSGPSAQASSPEVRQELGEPRRDPPANPAPALQRKPDASAPSTPAQPNRPPQSPSSTDPHAMQRASQPPATPSLPTPALASPEKPRSPGAVRADDLLPGWEQDDQAADSASSTGLEEPAANDETGAVHQHQPLEAAWPVKTTIAPETSSPEGAFPGAPQSHPTGSPAPAELPTQAVQVFPTGAQASLPRTVSSIEIVPPRRARPTLPTIQRAVEEVEPEIQPVPADQPQNQPASGYPATEAYEPQLPEAVPPPDITAQPVTAGQAGEPAPISGTPTEIGALPGDLWELIGEAPPRPTGETISARSQPAPRRSPENQAALPASTGHAFPVIQRQEDDETPPAGDVPAETASRTGAGVGQSAAESSKPEPASEAEIDQLARSVYAVLRRRLSEEWERVRRNF